MRTAEFNKYKEHINAYMSDDEIKNQIKYYNKNTFQAAMEMVQDGFFAVYFSQVLEALKEIYGDEYKPEIYETKAGNLRYKNNEAYCWSVYKGKIATAICKIVGE